MADPYSPSADTQKQMASQQIEQFKTEIFGHQLNLARLAAIPEADRDEAWQPAVDAANSAINTIKTAIDATQAALDAVKAGDSLPKP